MELVQRKKNNYKLHPKETVVNKTERERVCVQQNWKECEAQIS